MESKRRYPMATIYVSVYFPYSCSVLPLWRSGARENEEASGPEALREGKVGRSRHVLQQKFEIELAMHTDIFALVL